MQNSVENSEIVFGLFELFLNFFIKTLLEYLQKNCPVQKVENNIEATLVNENIQKYLDIEATEPCLLISRIVISNEEVASYSKLFYPSSRYKLSSTIESSGKNFV